MANVPAGVEPRAGTVVTPAPEDVAVLIPAAGLGERLGLGPKALLPLAGRPVLDWVVDKARCVGGQIIVAMPAGLAAPPGCIAIQGGPTRQESVRRLATVATRPWVLVWDAARPFGSLALAQAVLQAATRDHAGAAAVPPLQPSAFETPLAFPREMLLQVVQQAYGEGWTAASTMELVLRAGHRPWRVPGEATNLKLTTPQDWAQAQGLTALLRPDAPATNRSSASPGP